MPARFPLLSNVVARFKRGLQADYRHTFTGPHAEGVLSDLATFCRAREAPFVKGDPMATHVLIGRQEVFFRIARHLNLNEHEMWRLMADDMNNRSNQT